MHQNDLKRNLGLMRHSMFVVEVLQLEVNHFLELRLHLTRENGYCFLCENVYSITSFYLYLNL